MDPLQTLTQKLSPKQIPACEFRVGTSGYMYAEWAEAGFYPPGTQTGAMLPLYARTFPVTELSQTAHQLPNADVIERLRQQVPPEFRFAVCLTRTLTHEVDPAEWRRQALAFRNGVLPLLQGRQLAAVLVSLPPEFDYAPQHRQYLGALLSELEGLPLAVEFGHASWWNDSVFSVLAKRRVTLVPGELSALDIITNPELLYLRFAAGHPCPASYSPEALLGCVETRLDPLARQARQALIFFGRQARALAPANALALARALRAQGLPVRPRA